MRDNRYPVKRKPVEAGITNPSDADRKLRTDLESDAASSRTEFVRCLFEIQCKGLFRWTHARFQNYCEEVWGMSKTRLHYMQRESAALSEVVKRISLPAETGRVHGRERVRPILTSEASTKALSRVPAEKLDAVLDEIEGSDSSIPIKIRVQKAIETHAPAQAREAKAKPVKKVEVSVRSDVHRIGQGLVDAAANYKDAELYSVVCAACQQLRAARRKLR